MSLSRRQKGGALEVGTRDFLSCKWNASSEFEHLVARRMWTCGPVMCAGSHRSTQTHKHRRHVEETVCTFAIKKTNDLLPNFRRIKVYATKPYILQDTKAELSKLKHTGQ